ncbi:Fe2+-dependent dioxygenase [Sediminicurvatus halobius]|uniref:Fe2+-dependent dioxygenase n=1 Tax=Sediminicurvatus halobius TaxID=2182432 RepID=A0A2U2N5K1_9GAMM|nr:Fe2+-dependent dioxygenase [Spiribacter halobius]PWG64254.1 Fe2+-dependent dioxygenase [Spiribacter halobius]UEX79410.1 Fe2+-dependent dioxygenase [Spiribacter halobius]
MLLQIPGVIPPDTVQAFRELADRDDLFVDGRKTAGWRAKGLKKNLQGGDSQLVKGVLRKAEQAVLGHSVVQAAARPRSVVRMLFSRYDGGMTYGNHVDDALMGGQRTDVSFTLFVSAPESYEGGELVIDDTAGERAIKLDAGGLVIYPSTSLHRVEPVTAGRRVVVVGWLRSYIRDPGQRELLFDLDRAAHALRPDGEGGVDADTALDMVLKARSNLLRRWAED